MRTRAPLLLSLGLNLGLAVLLFLVWKQESAPPRLQPQRVVVVEPGPTVVRTNVFIRRQFFAWQELESTDYTTYIANLRSIGCPEQTIRDIIVADVNALFARRKASEIVTPQQQWWKSTADLDVVQASVDKHIELESERTELLARLLGPNWESTPGNPKPFIVSLTGPVLGNLSADVKQSVQEINERANQRARDYIKERQAAGEKVDPAELARQRREMNQELAKVLNGEQFEEYQLRHSRVADQMREELVNFGATPEEFRRLYRSREKFDEQIAELYSGNDPASVKRRAELEKQRDDLVKQELGADRFQVYQLNRDPAFRETQSLAERLQAAPETVLPLYQLTTTTETARQRIAADASLSVAERDAALIALKLNQERRLKELLGAEGYQRYQESQ